MPGKIFLILCLKTKQADDWWRRLSLFKTVTVIDKSPGSPSPRCKALSPYSVSLSWTTPWSSDFGVLCYSCEGDSRNNMACSSHLVMVCLCGSLTSWEGHLLGESKRKDRVAELTQKEQLEVGREERAQHWLHTTSIHRALLPDCFHTACQFSLGSGFSF